MSLTPVPAKKASIEPIPTFIACDISFFPPIEKRILRKITVDDCVSADAIFSKLMGDEVEPRRNFIEENARFVQNLDV